MNILDSIEECYGCKACFNACPVGAITMKIDCFGYWYPEVDDKKCIGCNKCKTVCPRLQGMFENSSSPACYAFMSDDELRKKSSTAGVFTLLAEYVWNLGGYVSGAIFSSDFQIQHVVSNSVDMLPRLRGSKYAQSDMKYVYREIKDLLEKNKYVLFVGTPCQVAAVKCYCGSEYDRLITCDILCHGVPSSIKLQELLDEKYGVLNIENVSFRKKGGWKYEFRVDLVNGKSYVEEGMKSDFVNMFIGNNISRESCYRCQFNRLPRQGDLTIGDFWHVKREKEYLDDGLGTNVVLVNNEKGKVLFDAIANKAKRYEAFSIETAVDTGVVHIVRGSREGARHNIFKNYLKTYSYAKSLDIARRHYDVGIVALWLNNYGTISGNLGLYNMFKENGVTACFIDLIDDGSGVVSPNEGIHKAVAKAYKYPMASEIYGKVDIKNLNNYIDGFVVGSDQMWNFSFYKKYEDYFHLSFADDTKKKISISTSLAIMNNTIGEDRLNKRKKYLERFDLVSVREDFSVDTMRRLFGIDAVDFLDPVFLCNKSVFIDFSKKSDLSYKDYVFSYWLYPTEEKMQFAKQVAKKMKKKLIFFTKPGSEAKYIDPFSDEVISINQYYRNWIYSIVHSDFIVTDSFHGSCMAIIFNKKFYTVKGREVDRFGSISRTFGLGDRFLEEKYFSADNIDLNSDIDFDSVNLIIDNNKRKAISRIINALK